MKRIMFMIVVLLSLLSALPVSAGQEAVGSDAVKTEALRVFEQALELWRAGDYDRLYNITSTSGSDTKESFSRRMAGARLKPSCCWERIQDVVVHVKSPATVLIRAKLGLDAPGEMEYKTKSIKMINESGEWRVARAEILSLAEAGKPRKSKNYRVKTAN